MEFGIITYAIIAIFGVSLLLLFATGSLQDAAKAAYCNAYRGIMVVLPSPEGGTLTLPRECIVEESMETGVIRDNDTEYVARKIAAYSIACMERANTLNLLDNLTCYELRLNKPVNVTEYNVTQILIEEGGCSKLENSDYGCGTKDQLIWDVSGGRITDQKIVLIEYVYNINAVKVVA